jgi:hypothetical protein
VGIGPDLIAERSEKGIKNLGGERSAETPAATAERIILSFTSFVSFGNHSPP